MFGKWADILMLNPLAPILEGLKAAVVDHKMPHVGWTLYSAAFTVFSLFVGFHFFKKWEPNFAESI
jgi:ABC-type polysaccharide/polyol phosphate export permease